MFLGKWDIGYEKSFSKTQIKKLLKNSGFKLENFYVEPHLKPANIFNYLDNLLNKINNKKFGFFIYFTAKKIKNV